MEPDSQQHPVIGPDHQLSAPPAKKKRTGLKVMVWIAVLAIFALGFFLLTRKSSSGGEKQAGAAGAGGRRGGGGGAATVTAEPAKQGDIGVYLNAIGTVTPVYTSSITAQVNGIVTDVHYREGQMVRKGDPLIDIDPRPFQATLTQAQGLLQRDQGVLAQAEMDLTRYQAAWAKNAIQKQLLDDQEKLVEQDKGTVKNDEGTVQYDQVQLSFCHITSPITGRAGLRLVDPGNVVQANGTTPLVVITQVEPITVVFTISEDSLGQVQPRLAQRARLAVDAFDRSDEKKIAAGTLLTLDNQIDTTTGTVKARASFDNRNSALFPNQFVNTRLLVNTLHNATLVPTAAIQHNGQNAFVYVIQNNAAHLKPVKVGVTNGDTAQVNGINPGDMLATSSFDKLQDNAPVEVSKQPLPPSGGGSNTP